MNSTYGYYCRPGLYEMLNALCLDATYDQAQGDRLRQIRGDAEVAVLDLVGGYGANLFGHNHPELLKEIQTLYGEKLPILAQGSCRSGAARLAKALCDLLGDDYVTIFTNSGTETVEAAIKHSYLQRQKTKFWAVKGAFHGKTLGAIQLNWNYHQPFTQYGPQVDFLDPFDSKSWQNLEAESDLVNAVFIEPILGEGGIKPLPQEFLSRLKDICLQKNIPLIADEIQTGMGRTGTFLASRAMGIDPDYICLSKSLGGGLVKIGALLIKREHYVPEFSIIHTSTFAEDDLSCRLALKALEILTRDELMLQCQAKGDHLIKKLSEVQKNFPQQIKEVRGKGLMVGIELGAQNDSASNSLRMISKQGYLGFLASAYFLNVHDIRIATTLSQPLTLRVEPSAYIEHKDIDHFINALTMFCKAVEALDLKHLTSYLVNLPATTVTENRGKCHPRRECPETASRVAFLGNLATPELAAHFDPILGEFTDPELEAYLDRTSKFLGPTIFDQINIHSVTGEATHLSFIGLNLTARQVMTSLRENKTKWIIEKIDAALALARSEGCRVLGLGGHTSIITRNGLRLKPDGIVLTSGNSLTVGMGIQALKKAAQIKNIDIANSRLAIVGALGNIASVYAELMAPEVKEMVLIVHTLNSPGLEMLFKDIQAAAPKLKLSITDNLDALKNCPLIVSSTNSPDPLIYPTHLSDDPVVICDISVPGVVAESVRSDKPNALVIQGGLVSLPCNGDLTISGVPLQKGQVFACMAETLLMGFEGLNGHTSHGKLHSQNVKNLLNFAEKHGFRVGEIMPKENNGLQL